MTAFPLCGLLSAWHLLAVSVRQSRCDMHNRHTVLSHGVYYWHCPYSIQSEQSLWNGTAPVYLSVCPSMGHISNLYCCSPAGRRNRSTAGTGHSMQWANVGSATLSAYIVAKHTLVSTDSFFWWLLHLNTVPSVVWRGWSAGRASGLWKTDWWGAGMAICLERNADLHMAQLMPLPLSVSCFSKIQIGVTFLVPAQG